MRYQHAWFRCLLVSIKRAQGRNESSTQQGHGRRRFAAAGEVGAGASIHGALELLKRDGRQAVQRSVAKL
jgi:hypothetical protein